MKCLLESTVSLISHGVFGITKEEKEKARGEVEAGLLWLPLSKLKK